MPTGNGKKPKPAPPLSRGLRFLDGLAQRAITKGGGIRGTVHMAHLLVVNIRRTQLTRMAAALSYRTIFGLIPILVVGLLLIAVFASRDQLSDTVDSLLTFTGFKEVLNEAPPMPDPSEVGPSPVVAEHAADQSRRLNAWIQERYESIRNIPSGMIGFIGVLTLMYAALSMLIEIEKAFNQIYNAPEGRSMIRRITQYWTLLTLGTLLLALSFYVQKQLTGRAERAHIAGLTSEHMKLIANGLSFLLTVCISTVCLFVIYVIVPNTRVQVFPALIGAFTAAVLWESGKWGFTAYLDFATGYKKIYGAIAILPLFFLWIYITWLIVLLGLQLASALQTQRLSSGKEIKFSLLATFGLVDEDAIANRVKILDPASVLVVVTAIAERFAAGKTSDHASIGDKTGIDEQAVADMLERLAGAGLIVRVEQGEGEPAYSLTRPPEAMPAADVLSVAQELVSVRTCHAPLLDNLAHARIAALSGKSVADLMQRPAPEEVSPLVRPSQP